jgi:clathrin light chain A
MSEFDAFESAEPTQTEEDPAAAFLAREQDQLAGLEDDDGFGPSTGAEPSQSHQGDLGDDFGGFGTQDLGNQDDNSLFDPMSGGEAPSGNFSNYDALSQDDNRGMSPPQPERIRIEPEKIRLWREEQLKVLEEKDAKSEKARLEWAEIAKKELDDWYRHRNEQLEKTKVSNRDSEKDFVQERDEKNPGHEWERICRLCEFNPKVSRSQKDISRMRSILLQLKQTPLTRA